MLPRLMLLYFTNYDNDKSRRRGKKQQQSSNGISGETPSSSTISVHHDHLLPLPLVLTVLVYLGLFWIASFRDVMATGKPILDTLGVLWGQDDVDANFLVSVAIMTRRFWPHREALSCYSANQPFATTLKMQNIQICLS